MATYRFQHYQVAFIHMPTAKSAINGSKQRASRLLHRLPNGKNTLPLFGYHDLFDDHCALLTVLGRYRVTLVVLFHES